MRLYLTQAATHNASPDKHLPLCEYLDTTRSPEVTSRRLREPNVRADMLIVEVLDARLSRKRFFAIPLAEAQSDSSSSDALQRLQIRPRKNRWTRTPSGKMSAGHARTVIVNPSIQKSVSRSPRMRGRRFEGFVLGSCR